MRRRGFLAFFGTAVLGGCSGADSTATPRTETPLHTTTSSPTPTPTTSRSTESAPAETATDTATQTDTETKTESLNVRNARDNLDQAREWLNRGVEGYLAQAGPDVQDPTLLDVDATVDFEPNDVLGWTGNAYDRINRAERTTQGQLAEEIQVHREARTFLSRGAQLQNRLHQAYLLVGSTWEYLHEEEFARAATEPASMTDHLDWASEYLLDVTTGSTAQSMEILEGVDGETYRAKITQWREELAALEAIQSGLIGLADGIETMDIAMQEYTDGDDRFTSFGPRILDEARDDITSAPTPESLEDTLDDLRSLARAFADASGEMDSAAAARENGNDRAAARQECDAREAIIQYGDYRDFRVARSIFDTADCPG